MKNGQKLLKDTLLYGIANFGSSIVVFFMLPIYTHYFTTTEYGLWDLALTTSTLLMPFITFEMVSAVYRWLIEETDEQKRSVIITTGALTIARNLAIFNILACIVLIFIHIPFGKTGIIFINIGVISSFIQQCARGLGFNKLFASLGMIQTIITVSLNLFFIFGLALRIESFFYATIIAGIFVIVFAWKMMNFSKYISIKSYSKEMIGDFYAYALPIIPGAASWWVMTMSDRYFITVYLGMEYNGIYAIVNKIPALLLMIHSVFFLAWKDSAILEFNAEHKDDYYTNVFKHLFRFMATTTIILTLATKPILRIFIAADFFHAWKYIGILLVGTLFHIFSLFWSAGYHGAKQTNIIFTTSLIGAGINVLVNFLLIRRIGLYAVVLSSLLSFLAVWLIRAISADAHFKITMNVKDMLILFPLIILAIIAPFMIDGAGLVIGICLGVLLFAGYNWAVVKMVWSSVLTNIKRIN